MSMRLTLSTSTIPLFDLVDDDDENTLVCQLDEQPHLINIRDEVSLSAFILRTGFCLRREYISDLLSIDLLFFTCMYKIIC
jgi:hypothetical protein